MSRARDLAKINEITTLLPGRIIKVDVYTTQNGTATSVSNAGMVGTWTKPAGCTNVLVYCTGGGGGARSNDSSYRGAGGGGGATAIGYYDVSSINSVAISVGGGGVTARGSGRGGTGGTSSFGSFCTATGGVGGQSDDPYEGGRGGDASGGFVNLPGGGGEMAHGADREGGGGESYWFKSGSNHWYSTTGGSVPTNTYGQWGSGGGRGHYAQNYPTNGNGGGGVVIVYSYS
jgi:hypothetical protein